MGDWCDEYYILYPDGFGIRKITLYSSYKEDDERHTDDEGHEWHEGIVVYHAYTTLEQAVNTDAVHVANMKGEVGIWTWEKPGEPETPMAHFIILRISRYITEKEIQLSRLCCMA